MSRNDLGAILGGLERSWGDHGAILSRSEAPKTSLGPIMGLIEFLHAILTPPVPRGDGTPEENPAYSCALESALEPLGKVWRHLEVVSGLSWTITRWFWGDVGKL